MISALKQEVVEDGREHPFVVALVHELRKRLADYHFQLEGAASSGGEQMPRIYSLGGGAREVRSTIQLIEQAEGEKE
jgi:hypothetical protein